MNMKDITGFEGLYAVTDDGRVWAHPKQTKVGKNGGKRLDDGRWLTLNKHRHGANFAHRVYLAKDGRKHPRLVHRLVAEAFILNPDELPFINHIDGNPANNHVKNLEWCDAQGNAKHAFDTGLTRLPSVVGEKNGQSKLTKPLVRQIRAKYAINGNMSKTARELGVTLHCVRGVIKLGYWSHVG